MSTFYDLRTAQVLYEQRLRDAEHDRQVKRMAKANGEGLAKWAAKVAGGVATVLGLAQRDPARADRKARGLVSRRT